VRERLPEPPDFLEHRRRCNKGGDDASPDDDGISKPAQEPGEPAYRSWSIRDGS
jgi:hypothetical protein